jgi:predicted RNA binding protein YcfA (HicA-like mRNA interferase family)
MTPSGSFRAARAVRPALRQWSQVFDFELSRTEGSHNIFSRPDIPELVNLQNVKGQAKPYQMRQFLKLVEKHNLKLED